MVYKYKQSIHENNMKCVSGVVVMTTLEMDEKHKECEERW